LASIINEVEALVAGGTREVMLLGQNVDAYRWENTTFADCLSAVAQVKGLERVRFLTSHPQDIHISLFEVMAANPKVCPYLHLPVQSGSNRILGLMNRGYTRERYIDIIEEARALVPQLALSTDIIVGFPSETEREFEDTLELAEQIRFDSAFMFKYSSRPNTKAAKMPDDVPEPDKIRRLEKLITHQGRIASERNKEQIGRVDEILIEGFSPKNDEWLFGRTPDFRPGVFSPNVERPGQVVRLRLAELRGFTFVGEHTAQ
jgi:tRNA-2-methylthio-N6-dimethylallyladenosine synthase